MPNPNTDIIFYTASTPNGQKISITLEELGLKYETIHIDLSKNTQKKDMYLKINPNGRIPAIIDKTPVEDKLKGQKVTERRVFEGQAILMWLTHKYDKDYKVSYAFDTDKYWEVVQWVSWMQSGIGPMQGEADHFYRYSPEKIEYAIKRYQTETKRLYQVLENRLAEQRGCNRTAAGTLASRAGPVALGREGEGPWLVGNKMTIADIACFSWINWAECAGIDVGHFKEISDWLERINGREAVKRGLDVPEPFQVKEKEKTKAGEEEYAKYYSWLIMNGEQKD